MVGIKKILVPTDFSEYSKSALPYAVDLAKKYNARMVILHIFDEELLSPIFFEAGGSAKEYYDRLQNRFEAAIDDFLSGVDTENVEVEAQLGNGTPFVEIIRFARENGVDLIIMGTHGRSGIAHALLGSVTEKVVRKSPCPVMVVRHPEFKFEMP